MNIPISNFKNFARRVPSGDNVERMVCGDCDWIHYENPRVIVTAMCVWENQVLLCRRAIPPRYGFWTLPGGFMEIDETIEEGACREVREEAGAAVTVQSLLATYTVPRIGQVHLVFLATLNAESNGKPRFSAGEESLDVQLFPLERQSLPWQEFAFPVNHWAFEDYLSLQGQPITHPFTTRPEHLTQRMSPVPFHPDFPPDGSRS